MKHLMLLLLFFLTACIVDPPEPPAPFLSRLSKVSPGAECTYGGQKLDSGQDLNKNEVLDGDEITQTEYVCNEAPTQQAFYFEQGFDGYKGMQAATIEEDTNYTYTNRLQVSNGLATKKWTFS